MKEKDIRDRIARFLQKTARTVVVPASMGLGLSATGCDRHSLHGKGADAGPDLVTQNRDAATNPPDLADAATKDDLPLIAVPYLVVMVEDALATAAFEPAACSSFEVWAFPPPPPHRGGRKQTVTEPSRGSRGVGC